MKIQQMILRVFLAVQIVGVGVICIVGDKGWLAVRKIKVEHEILKKALECERIEIEKIEHEMHAWKTNDFYKEQCAREQLQMARPEEEIYILD